MHIWTQGTKRLQNKIVKRNTIFFFFFGILFVTASHRYISRRRKNKMKHWKLFELHNFSWRRDIKWIFFIVVMRVILSLKICSFSFVTKLFETGEASDENEANDHKKWFTLQWCLSHHELSFLLLRIWWLFDHKIAVIHLKLIKWNESRSLKKCKN